VNNLIKALLLNVNLRWVEDVAPDGGSTGSFKNDPERTERLTTALDRLTIDVEQLEPDMLGKMLDSGEEAIEWLVKHPKANVELSRWQITIVSSEFDDVDHERFDYPLSDHSMAVEDFWKSRSESGSWECGWSLG
jgi:hypothetical protein